MSYWKRARAWAWERTETFSIKKAAPALIAGAVQFWFFHMRSMTETALILVTVLGAYVFLFGLEFFWKFLVSAPVALDKERTVAISALESELKSVRDSTAKPKVSPLEQGRRDAVEKMLADYTEDEKHVLRYLLQTGKQEGMRLPTLCGRAPEIVASALNKRRNELTFIVESQRVGYPDYWDIKEVMRDALAFHLLRE